MTRTRAHDPEGSYERAPPEGKPARSLLKNLSPEERQLAKGFHLLTNKPINGPEDLAGVRMRTPGAPVWTGTIRAMGAEKFSEAVAQLVANGYGQCASVQPLTYRALKPMTQ